MRIPMRSLSVAATFLLSVLFYVDRVCISAAKNEVASDLSLSDQQMRRVLAAIVAVWSLFTGLTAAAGSFGSMLVVRFLFIAGEAGALPGMSRAMFSWIPMQERGLVQGINFSGSRIGAAVTLPLIAGLIRELG